MVRHFDACMTRNIPFLISCATGLAAVGIAVGSALREPSVHEEVIAQIGADVRMGEWELVSSDDAQQIAWREKRGNKWAVVLNSAIQGSGYDEVKALFFSPDQRHLAYAARSGKEWTAIVDSKKQGQAYQKVAGMYFSADSSRFAFLAKVEGGWRYVVDATPGATDKELTRLAFSSDSRHFAYSGKRGNQWVMVTDGAEGPAFDYAGAPYFRKNGQTPVYVAQRKNDWMLVADGQQEQLWQTKDGYRLIGLTPQTEEPVFKIFDGDQSKLRVGNREGPLGDVIEFPFSFPKNGEHFVYATARIRTPAMAVSERAYGQVVVDGTPGHEYEGAPVESGASAFFRAMGGEVLQLQRGDVPEFTAVTYSVSTPAVRWEGLHVAYAARRGNKDFTVVVDGQEGPRMDAVPCAPAYSPHGDLYYAGVDAGKLVLMVNGQRVSEIALPTGEWTEKKDVCSDFRFGEGGHFVYSILLRDSWRIFVDGVENKRPFVKIFAGPVATLAADGRFHYAYAGWPDITKPQCYVVVDGFDSKMYNDIWPSTVRWTDDGVLTFLARESKKLLRVTESLP